MIRHAQNTAIKANEVEVLVTAEATGPGRASPSLAELNTTLPELETSQQIQPALVVTPPRVHDDSPMI